MKFKPNYIIIPLITILVAVIGSSFTITGADSWYQTTLIRPSINPPNWVFPIAWNIIFLLTTISALIFWNQGPEKKKFLWIFDIHKEDKKFTVITVLFLLNAFLNVFWSYLFFGNQNILAALIEMLFLEATLIALIILLYKRSKAASLLLLPYTLWVAFATYLTYLIFTLN